jgi:predicted metal-binding membrane protein
MESASIRQAPPLSGSMQVGLVGALFTLAAAAWAITSDRMTGMDGGPGTDPGALGFFIGVWVVMMAAMMLPSIAPMVVMQARIQEGGRERAQAVAAGATALFVAGYLVAWSAAGLVGYAVYELGRAVTGDVFAWENAGPYLAGGVILAAAVYQLTPLKNTCLRHCRSPFAFLVEHWRPGRLGALWMGIAHGGWCVGCCWALMAGLLALGVMSLGWMALIATLIAVEKLLPWKELASRGIAVLLLVLGIGVAFTPASVPGLTIPGSMAMEMMGDMGEGSRTGAKEMQGMREGSSSGGPMGGQSSHGPMP